MSTETLALLEIAKAIQALKPDPPGFWKTDLGQAVLFAGSLFLGIFATMVKERMKRLSQRGYTRDTLTLLLGDEILLRWDAMIGKILKEEFALVSLPLTESSNLQPLRNFSEAVATPDDLFTFCRVAERPSEVDVFKQPGLLSDVIYVHVLFKDLLDGRTLIQRELANFERIRSDDRAAVTAALETLSQAWEGVNANFRKLDSRMQAVWKALQPDYDRLLDKLRESVIKDPSAIASSMERSRARRTAS